MSAVKGLKSEVINEEDLFACHRLCHLCEDLVWWSSWAAEIPDRVIYTENWVSCRQKAAVGRHGGSVGHLCCVGQKDGVGEMLWWKQTLSLQHQHWGLGEDLMQGRACSGEAEVCLEGCHSPISILLKHRSTLKCLHDRLSGKAAMQAPWKRSLYPWLASADPLVPGEDRGVSLSPMWWGWGAD